MNDLNLMDKDLVAEATEAFYKWEKMFDVKDLSDEDRLLWCAGYVFRIEDKEPV